MIINTGSRTDTVQYYSDWLLKRFDIQAADMAVVVWRIGTSEIMILAQTVVNIVMQIKIPK